jgi:IgA peptidase M64
MPYLLRRIGIATLMSVAGILLLGAQAPVQIYPSDGSDGGKVLIVVLADNFTTEQEADFNHAADNFINVELVTDPFYAMHAGSFTVKTIFSPVAAQPASNYGFTYESGVTNCNVSWDQQNTVNLLTTAAVPAVEQGKDAPLIVVIGNYETPFGCAQGNVWTYVARGAFGHEILRHEMGHLFSGLFDEYALTAHRNESHPDRLDQLNCSADEDPPWDDNLDPPQPACDLYGLGVFHPTSSCKMDATKRGPFCDVCSFWMTDFFSPNPELENPDVDNPNIDSPEIRNPDIENPAQKPPKPPTGLKISGAGFFGQPAPKPPPAQPPQPQPPPPASPSVRVLLQISTGTQAARVLRATDAVGPLRNNYQRRGDYVYEVSENDNVLAIGVVTGDPFDTRSYNGSAPRHATGTAPTGTILVTIPNETRARLRPASRSVEIWIYKLAIGLQPGPITPARFANLKLKDQANRLFRVSPDVLKAALQ